jgi:hypothetical protein
MISQRSKLCSTVTIRPELRLRPGHEHLTTRTEPRRQWHRTTRRRHRRQLRVQAEVTTRTHTRPVAITRGQLARLLPVRNHFISMLLRATTSLNYDPNRPKAAGRAGMSLLIPRNHVNAMFASVSRRRLLLLSLLCFTTLLCVR